jgi:hypothetical protein
LPYYSTTNGTSVLVASASAVEPTFRAFTKNVKLPGEAAHFQDGLVE